MNRREFLLASAGLGASLLAGCGLPFLSRRKRHNIVLIVCDTLRADHVGCCGSRLRLTPRVDELARRGAAALDVTSSAPLTGAAIASLMTGLYQTHHGVVSHVGRLPEGMRTLAEVCRSADYVTAAFVGNPVLKPEHLRGIERGFSHYDAVMPSVERNRPASVYRDAEETTKAVLRWLGERKQGPFFLWIHYMEPHGPYEVHDPSKLAPLRSAVRVASDPARLPVLQDNYGPGGIPAYQVLGEERDPVEYRARYAARAEVVDSHLGQVLAELDRSGLTEQSVVAVTADHGELMGEHRYYFQHGVTLLQPVLHIPLVIAAPGMQGGQRVRAPASNVDIMPTLLQLAGLSRLSPETDGQSLAGLLHGEPEGPARAVYALSERDREWCIKAGKRKLTLSQGSPTGREGLFDLETDPGEEHDLSYENPSVAGELRKTLQGFMATDPDVLSRPETAAPPMTEEERQRLKSLGYLR